MRFLLRLLRNLILFSVIAGLASAVGAYLAKGRIAPRGGPADDEIEVVAIYGASDLASTAAGLRRARITAMYGGGTLDLRGATLDPAGATLTIRALFGGYLVIVPETWRVDVKSIDIFGRIGDARRKDLVTDGGPRLTVDGFAVLGGAWIVAKAPDVDRAPTTEAGPERQPAETGAMSAPA